MSPPPPTHTHTQLADGTENGDDKPHTGADEGATANAGDVIQRKTRGFPRIFKAGWGIKLGAVVSSMGGAYEVMRLLYTV